MIGLPTLRALDCTQAAGIWLAAEPISLFLPKNSTVAPATVRTNEPACRVVAPPLVAEVIWIVEAPTPSVMAPTG